MATRKSIESILGRPAVTGAALWLLQGELECAEVTCIQSGLGRGDRCIGGAGPTSVVTPRKDVDGWEQTLARGN